MLWLLAVSTLVALAEAQACTLTARHPLGIITIQQWGDDSARVRIGPQLVEPVVQGLLPTPPATDSSCNTDGTTWLSNGNLNVSIANDGGLTFTRLSDNTVLLSSTSMDLAPFATTNATSPQYLANISFAYALNDKIYGLGEHRTGQVAYTDYYHNFQDSQEYPISHGSDIMIPFYSTASGYGFLWNTASFGSVNLSTSTGSIAWYSQSAPQLDFWVTTVSVSANWGQPGGDVSPFPSILSHFVDAVGHAPVLPFFASGFWQCKLRYRNQTELISIASQYINLGLPISVIVVDYVSGTLFSSLD